MLIEYSLFWVKYKGWIQKSPQLQELCCYSGRHHRRPLINYVKMNKKGGQGSVYTAHVINGSDSVWLRLTAILCHGFTPDYWNTAPIQPLVKDKRKSCSDSGNYMGIKCTSSILKSIKMYSISAKYHRCLYYVTRFIQSFRQINYVKLFDLLFVVELTQLSSDACWICTPINNHMWCGTIKDYCLID